MGGPANLTTARLRLRPVSADDLDELHVLWADPEVRRYLMDGRTVDRGWSAGTVRRCVEEFEAAGLGMWLVSRRRLGDIVGFCGLRDDAPNDEVGLIYGIAPAFWGQGLASEAARALLGYGFGELDLPRIVAGADAPNAASLRVLDKLGMRYERSRPGAFGKIHWYGLAREDFVAADAAR